MGYSNTICAKTFTKGPGLCKGGSGRGRKNCPRQEPKEEKVLRKEGSFILDEIGNEGLCFLIHLPALSSLWWVSMAIYRSCMFLLLTFSLQISLKFLIKLSFRQPMILCHALHSSGNWPNWGDEGMGEGQIHITEKLGSGRFSHLDGGRQLQQQPGTSVCLFYTSESEQWGYGTQMNKE